jgi:hypothetical protein
MVDVHRDDTDIKIEKLKSVNSKLMSKMKEINIVLEKTIEKAKHNKIVKINKQGSTNVKLDA